MYIHTCIYVQYVYVHNYTTMIVFYSFGSFLPTLSHIRCASSMCVFVCCRLLFPLVRTLAADAAPCWRVAVDRFGRRGILDGTSPQPLILGDGTFDDDPLDDTLVIEVPTFGSRRLRGFAFAFTVDVLLGIGVEESSTDGMTMLCWPWFPPPCALREEICEEVTRHILLALSSVAILSAAGGGQEEVMSPAVELLVATTVVTFTAPTGDRGICFFVLNGAAGALLPTVPLL